MAIHHISGTATDYKNLLLTTTQHATTSSVLTTAGIAWQPERSTFIFDSSRTPQLFIGASDKAGVKGDYLTGTIDELAIYNAELSQAQVTANYGNISASNGDVYRTTVTALSNNYYRLDEASGAVITDLKAVTNGVYTGTVTYSQTGIFGAGGGDTTNNAISLDGSTSYLDFSSAFTAGFGNQARSVEFSFKTSANGCLACFKQNLEWYGFFIESGNLIFRSSTLQNEGVLTIASSVADNTYKHFVFARDIKGHFKAYLNGTLVYTYAPTVHEVALKGVGNGGLDEIYVAMQTEESSASGWYNWNLNGYSGYVRTGDFFTQPIALQNDIYLPALLLWNTTTPYDIVVSGRYIKVVARVSTNDEHMYLGLGKNYGLPAENPYPIIVAGSHFQNNIYSNTSGSHSCYFNPITSTSGNSGTKINIGGWINIYNTNGSPTIPTGQVITDPYCNYSAIINNLFVLDNQTKPLIPINIIKHYQTIYALFDDSYHVSYTNQSSGDTITEAGETFKVFQNVFRNDKNSFVAIRIV